MTEGGAEPRHTLEEIWALLPGLARLMPEIADRWWKCYYAADAGNWDLARWQLREMTKLFRIGNMTRPKYADDVNGYLQYELRAVTEAIEAHDRAAFRAGFEKATVAANLLHQKWNKGFIVWKLPEQPPLDLELRGD